MKSMLLAAQASVLAAVICVSTLVLAQAQSPIADVSADDLAWQDHRSRSAKVIAADRYGDLLPEGALQRLGTIRYRQPQRFGQQVCFLSDSNTLLACGNDGHPPALVDAWTGKTRGRIAWNNPMIRLSSATASANGRFVLVVAYAYDRPTREYRAISKLWDASNRQPVASCSWDGEAFFLTNASAVSNDGTLAAIAGRRGELYVWAIDQPEPEVVQVAEGRCQELRFTDDAQRLILRGMREVHLWDLQAEKLVYSLEGFSGTCSMAVSPDNSLLAIGDRHLAGASLWDMRTGERVRLLKAQGRSRSIRGSGVAFNSDGSRLFATSPEEGTVEVFDVATGESIALHQLEGTMPRTLAVSPDGKLLSGSVGRSALTVLQASSCEDLTSEFTGHYVPPLAIEFTGDGRRLISSGMDGTMIVWSLENEQPIHVLRASVELGGTGSITALAISTDGKRLLSNGFGVGLDCWDLETGELIYHLARHGRTGQYGAHACGFTPEGERFISFGPQYFFRVWDERTGKALLEERPFPPGIDVELDDQGDIKGDNDPFGGALFGGEGGGPLAPPMIRASFLSDDASRLVYVADKLYWVDTLTGKVIRDTEIGRSIHVLLTKDLTTVALADSQNAFLSIRSTNSGEEKLKIDTGSDSARPYCFSHDGGLLAARSYVRSEHGPGTSWLGIYDTQSGEKRYHIEGEDLDSLQCATFSPDGTKIAMSQSDSSILLMDLQQFRVDRSP